MAEEIGGLAITNIDGGLNANGLFINGNPLQAQALSNVVPVSDITDLPTPVGSDIFLNDNTLYNFNAVVDIVNNTIKYGTNSSIVGIDKAIAGLLTTSAQPMLDCNGNRLTVRNMTLNAPAPVDCDTEEATIERCDFKNFATAVKVTNINNLFVDQCSFIAGERAIDINGTSNGTITLNLNVFNAQTVACVDMFDAIIETYTENVNAHITGDVAAFGILGNAPDSNGIATNITIRGFVLGSIFNGAGQSLGGITKKDVNWDFQSNSPGVVNSTVIGGMDQVANVTTTVLSTGTFIQLAGTFSATGDIERFQVASNQIVAQVTGEGVAGFKCDATKIGGGPTNDLQFALFKNGGQSGDIIRRIELDVAFINVSFDNDVSFVASDVFDVRVNRVSGNDDVQVNNATLFLR